MTELSFHVEGRGIGVQMDALAGKLDAMKAKAALRAAAFAGGKLSELVIRELSGGTGQLARSFLPPRLLSDKGETVSAGALSDLVYAGILDRGGTITPRSGQALAVPLTAQAKRMWPRDWPAGKLALIKSRAGKLLLAETRRGRLTPHYVLKPSVTIRARNYTAKAAKESKDGCAQILAEDMRRAIKEGT